MTENVLTIGNGRIKLWRDAPSLHGLRTAAVSDLRCSDAAQGTIVLEAATEHLGNEGFQAVIGPMEGDTWHSYRLVTESDGSSPFLMEPTSAPHHLQAFEDAGFEGVASYFSARAAVAAALGQNPDPVEGVTITTWDGADPEAHFTQVHTLSTQAFAQNLFYKPIALDAFLKMYLPFVPMLVKDLIFLAHDTQTGALVGYLFGLPNYAEGQTPPSVILKTYASLRPGVGHLLSHAFHQAARDMGFDVVIHALIHDDNRSAQRSRLHGGTIFRRYGLMGRVL